MDRETRIQEQLDKRRHKDQVARELLDKVKNMKWIEVIQMEGQEERLKLLESNQRWAWDEGIKKRKLKVDPDEFAHYFTELLAGECKSIKDYLRIHETKQVSDLQQSTEQNKQE